MTALLARARRCLAGALAALREPASVGPWSRKDPCLGSTWEAWHRGDFAQAAQLATELLTQPQTIDAGHHMLALVAHVSGRHDQALAHHRAIGPRYPWRGQLAEPIFQSYLHLRDLDGAQLFARKQGLARCGAAGAWLSLSRSHPMAVELRGVLELPFTDDSLTPYMPGVPIRLNGRAAVARLDTGGTFLHLSAEQAARFGVKPYGCEKAFAALRRGNVHAGTADLELGPLRIANLPVEIHEGVLARAPLGVELGPIIGTNLFELFLTTIDAPHWRLLLSGRYDAPARDEHLRRLVGQPTEIPFALWGIIS